MPTVSPRELHINQAKDAIDYRVWPEYRTSYDSTKPTSELIHCPYFTVNRVVVQVAAEVDLHTDSFVVVVCLWGEANINGIRVKQGETLLVPASFPFKISLFPTFLPQILANFIFFS